jgi:membrane fusion protein (multidrug efflux system)
MARSRLLIFVAGGIAAFTILLALFQFVGKPAMIRAFISKAPLPVTVVAAVEAREEKWVPRLPATGSFRAIQGIDIAPQTAGVLRAINFQSGQDVEAGALLVEIDDAVEQADLKSSIANLRNADLALERQQQLIIGGSTARASFDQAQAARDQAAAAVEKERALIDQKALRAPFAGRLGIRKLDVGQYITPGTSVVTLQQLDPMFLDFNVPEQNLGQLAVGQDVEVKVDSFADRIFKGNIVSVDARISAETRNVLVRAQVSNADKLLRPGMFASIAVLAGAERNVVIVPRTAVTYSLYGDAVFVIKPLEGDDAKTADGKQIYTVERRFVRTGEMRGEFVALDEGVKAGDNIVAEGQVKLLPNARVTIDNSRALPVLTTLPKE